MMPFSRADRVSGLIQKILSDILTKQVADPRLKMTIITAVEMSSDLKLARIYYTTSGRAREVELATTAMNKARGFLKRKLAQQLHLRYMPELKFYYDESFEYGSHIEHLLKTVMNENGPDHTSN
jgi:ribosome-binding factor A